MDTYLAELKEEGALKQKPIAISLGVAGPDNSDRIRMSNLSWDVDAKFLKDNYDFEYVGLMNDFVAVAKSIKLLDSKDYKQVGDGYPQNGQSVVIGPGTGLGLATIVPYEDSNGVRGEKIIPGEIEVTDVLFTSNGAEEKMIQTIKHQFGKPILNDLIRGQGLLVMYNAICHGKKVTNCDSPADVTYAGKNGDREAQQAFNTFCSFLGRAAGNFSSLVGATQGVYIAGGIVPRMLQEFEVSSFADEFENKGPGGMTSKIPTYVITRDPPALLGLRHDMAPHLK